MKTIHTLSQEFKKTIFNLGFLTCVLITATLFFTTQLYIETSTGKVYSVLEVIFSLDKTIIKSEISFASINIFQLVINGYFLMFIPIIAAFPFIPNFCSERNSGLIRYTIGRTGKMRYYITKFISALLGGGLAVLVGYAVFGIIISIIFPPLSSYTIPNDLKSYYDVKDTVPIILKSLLGAFLYGAVSAIPAFLMASFVKNRYIITCVPFMIIYLYNTSLTKISYDAMENSNQGLSNLAYTLRPDTISSLAYFSDMVRNSLLINLAFVVICFLVFVLIMNRRWDLGE